MTHNYPRATLMRSTTLALIAAFACLPAAAAAPDWRVVLSAQSPSVLLPQLPTTGYALDSGTIEASDNPSASMHFELTPTNGSREAWLERGGVLLPMAQPGVVGATGPGRVGAESAHVFRVIGEIESNAQDQRIFAARAGDPAQSIDAASLGIWRASSTGNVEIARALSDGVFGPGLGSNWFFIRDFDLSPLDNGANLSRVHALPDGQVLFDAMLRPPGEPFGARRALLKHTPGLGNVPCAVVGVTDLSLSPGVLLGDAFTGIGNVASSPHGEIYSTASLAVNAPPFETRRGIWRFCNGAPQIKALSANTGALGPNIAGSPGAVFTDFRARIAPSTSGSFYFSGQGSPTFKGVFYHRNGQNRPVLLNDTDGALGPGIAGFRFNQSLDFETQSAGQFGVFYGFSRNPSTGVEHIGLWRLRPDAVPEPFLIKGANSPYPPAPGRQWDSVTDFGILENGVVLVVAATITPPSATRRLGIWRLRPGRAPEEILKAGDPVRYPTATGIQTRNVRNVGDLFVLSASDGLQNYAGDDSWISASGSVLAEVELEGMEGFIFPTRYVRAQVTDLNVLFEDGFEQ